MDPAMTCLLPRARRGFPVLVAACLPVLGLAHGATAQTAHYTVTFEATWSALTHPVDFPPDPHFSGLVGGTHDATVSFWNQGEPASLGIKRMAEWGSQAELLADVEEAVGLGLAETTVADPPLWTVPGSTSVALTLTPDFPLVTMVAMIAPSPDWFVGVGNLDLRPGGEWIEEIVVELYPFDAGTDSGPGYTSPDQATIPPGLIAPIAGYPFSAGVPLGTFTFTRVSVAGVPVAPGLRATVHPNPFNPRTTIAWELPAAGHLEVDICDAAGRRVRKLWNGAAQAGPGRAVWNGEDAAGRPVAAGVYFANVRSGVASVTRKITLVR